MARDHAILKREIAQPRRAPSLPDLLTYLMDQHGLSRADLVPLWERPVEGARAVELFERLNDRLHQDCVEIVPVRFFVCALVQISPH
jgi:hypothetical protein